MVLELSEKVALVTGSTRGIGLAIAEKLTKQGHRVVINSRSREESERVALDIENAIAVAGNVCEPTEAKKVIDEVYKKFGRLDILVCNVGSGASVPPGQEYYEEWCRVFNINFWSATNMVEAAQNLLSLSKEASIVCISSICGVETIPGAPITYSAAKAALNAYVRGVSRPLADKGIRINAVAAGNIYFDTSVWARKLNEDEVAVKKMLAERVALKRLGTPNEVAELVMFLSSDKASFATGQIWTLDGGQTHS